MSRSRHVPLRRCVVCRSSRPQAELIRCYRDETGRYQLDPTGKAGGRGAWLCRYQQDCHDPKKLRRFFRADAETIWQQLITLTDTILRTEGGMNVRKS